MLDSQVVEQIGRHWGWVALRGVVAILFGLMAMFMPAITLSALVLVWGAFALADGVLALIAGIRIRDQGKPLWALIIVGLLGVAAGIVTFANPDLYLTGGTLVLDHGFGISSNFLHLSRIDVKVGDRIEQGQTIAAVGATGRATGPHLHWGMNWFDTRIDPLLVLERAR